MNINFKNNLILSVSYAFVLVLLILNIQNSFFWDTVQLGSKQANFYYSTNYSSLLLPDSIDSGHIPAFGIYISLIWSFFGRNLLTSHLAIMPFALGIILQLYIFIKKIVPEKFWGVMLVLILIDPSLLSQMTLVSPDVPLVFFFLLAINSVIKNNKIILTISIIFLFLVSMRGMMVSVCILFFDLFYNIYFTKNLKKLLLSLLKRSVIYLPALFIFILFSIFHYLEKGWIGFHSSSPWAESFETVDIKGFFFNIGILGWRIIDFGRIGIWVVFFVIFFKYRKEILNNKKVRLLILFFIITLIILSANILWAKNLIGHRYLIPVYLSFSILCAYLLFLPFINEKLRITLFLFWIVIISTGNFWIYPSKIAQGWDSTLAHLPYYNLRNKAIDYLDYEKIDVLKVASFFPNLSSFDSIDLNGNQKYFVEFDGTNEYLFYSNIFNVNDNEYEQIISDYDIIKNFKKNGVFVWICKKKL